MKTNKLFNTLRRANPILFISGFFIFIYLVSYITYLFPPSAGYNEALSSLESVWERYLIGVIIGPLLETLIFQALIIYVVCRIIKRPRYNLYASVLISAIAFGLNHCYNPYYVLYTFLIGIILAFVYYISRYRRMSPTLTVFIIHALLNFIAFIPE